MSVCSSPDCTSQKDRFKLFAIGIASLAAITFVWGMLPVEDSRQLALLNAETPYYSFQPLKYIEQDDRIKEWKYSLTDICYYWPKSDPDKCDAKTRRPKAFEAEVAEGTLNP